jgi:hypothetical protein
MQCLIAKCDTIIVASGDNVFNNFHFGSILFKTVYVYGRISRKLATSEDRPTVQKRMQFVGVIINKVISIQAANCEMTTL